MDLWYSGVNLCESSASWRVVHLESVWVMTIIFWGRFDGVWEEAHRKLIIILALAPKRWTSLNETRLKIRPKMHYIKLKINVCQKKREHVGICKIMLECSDWQDWPDWYDWPGWPNWPDPPVWPDPPGPPCWPDWPREAMGELSNVRNLQFRWARESVTIISARDAGASEKNISLNRLIAAQYLCYLLIVSITFVCLLAFTIWCQCHGANTTTIDNIVNDRCIHSHIVTTNIIIF